MCITTNQPDTKSNPNPNPTTKQHTIVNTQLNIVTCPMYPDKFIRDMLSHRLYYIRLQLSHCPVRRRKCIQQADDFEAYTHVPRGME